MPRKVYHKYKHQTPGQRDVVTLRDYIEARLTSIDKATDLAYQKMEIRLANMNEFRSALSDQTSRFITRVESQAARDSIKVELKVEMEKIKADLKEELSEVCSDVEVLRDFKSTMEGKASQHSVNVALVLGLIGAGVGVLSMLLAIVDYVTRVTK
jgi:gamma-glutamyl:cysteine ligase YbdK (ATP-grasp superfamily)